MNNRRRLAKRVMTDRQRFSYSINNALQTAFKQIGKSFTAIWNPKPAKSNAYAFRKRRVK